MSAFDQPLDPGVGLALLAAGSSRRFGGGKLFADLGGRPVWHWAAEAAETAGFVTRWLIVPDGRSDDFAREGWQCVVNAEAGSGMASSLRCAAKAARACERLVIGLADMPFVRAAHYRALAEREDVAFTAYPDGRNGVPAAFRRDDLARLMQLEGESGAAAAHWTPATAFAVPADELLDIDTPDDLARARSIAAMR